MLDKGGGGLGGGKRWDVHDFALYLVRRLGLEFSSEGGGVSTRAALVLDTMLFDTMLFDTIRLDTIVLGIGLRRVGFGRRI